MMLTEVVQGIRPLDEGARTAAKQRWDAVAHPLGSLGLLEDLIAQIAAMGGSPAVDLSKRAVIAMCADNGVVAEGVTQTGQEVTAVVAENMARGKSSVCCMARQAGAEVYPVDIGIARPVAVEGMLQRNIRRGTADLAVGPAMTREECERAVLTGVEIASDLVDRGYRILLTGEMGIGNTTTSSAVTAVLLGLDPAEVTGRGAGLSSEGLQRKIDAIRRGLAINRPDPKDPLDVVSKVGGLDIAGLMGVYLGGALRRVPVVVDGFIASVAALAAARLCPDAAGHMLASHSSGEPAGQAVLDALGLRPAICAGLRLGEGTGAVALLPLLDMALAVYREMSSFDDYQIDAYEHLH